MSIVTTQQLSRYYEQYRTTDVTFNKQVIAAVGLVPKGVYLKTLDRQVPCMVFSSSMSSARVIATVPALVMAGLKQPASRLSLRWCFKLPDKVEPITFFVTCRATGFTHYAMQGPDVNFVTLEFTQRPPDDLILILGSLLEANFNSQKRKDERILVNPETMKKLGLESREAALVVDGKERKCILRDLSFSGCRVIITGKPETYANRSVSLRITVGDQAPDIALTASVRRVDEVGGRKDILTASLEFSGDTPMSYKLLINSYISTLRKAAQEAGGAAAAASGGVSAPASAGGSPGGSPAPAGTPAPAAKPAPPADPFDVMTRAADGFNADIPAEEDPTDEEGGKGS
ncbi:MAG TPA: PilZ domain-containing protein [Spirochaetia bacterium]|nr:PilZ domain-containing protein [Spirochaetia bacterium]